MFRYYPAKDNLLNLFWFPYFLVFYNFAGNLSNDIYLPSLPILTQKLATTTSLAQLTLSIWFVGAAIPQLFLGAIADRYGRRPLLLAGCIIFLAASLLCAISLNIWFLLIGRFFQGVGVCSLNIVSFSVIRELFEFDKRVKLVTYINIFGSVAPLMGPVIGGYITTYLHWRVNFLFIFLLGIPSFIGLWKFMPESLLEFDHYALKPQHFISKYMRLLKDPDFMRHLLAYSLLLGALIAYLSGAPFFIIERLHLLPEEFGYLQLIIFAAYVASSLLTGYLAKKMRIDKIIHFGLLLILASASGLILIGKNNPHILFLLVMLMSSFMFCFGLVASLLSNIALATNASTAGAAASMLGFTMALSAALGSLITGIVYNGTLLSLTRVIFGMTVFACILFFYQPGYKKFITMVRGGVINPT